MRRNAIFATALIAAAAACTQTSPGAAGSGTSPEPEEGGRPWTGSVNPVTENAKDLKMSSRVHVSGRVDMEPGMSTNYTKLHIVFGAPFGNKSLSWALLPNRCGTDETPVVPVGTFPTLDLSASGRAEASVQLAFNYPESGQYHVNVYNGNTAALTDVVGCANLQRRR